MVLLHQSINVSDLTYCCMNSNLEFFGRPLLFQHLFLSKILIRLFFYVSGAYGEVRKCLSKETNALRAVKIINKKYLEETEKQKMLTEISILK